MPFIFSADGGALALDDLSNFTNKTVKNEYVTASSTSDISRSRGCASLFVYVCVCVDFNSSTAPDRRQNSIFKFPSHIVLKRNGKHLPGKIDGRPNALTNHSTTFC